jgi:hypothetical protein
VHESLIDLFSGIEPALIGIKPLYVAFLFATLDEFLILS